MLQAMREGAGKWLIRILLLLIIAGFAFWEFNAGFGNTSTDPATAPAITTDAETITLLEVERALRLAEPTTLPLEEKIAQGISAQIIRETANAALLRAEVADNALRPPQDGLVAQIMAEPALQTNGVFDPQKLQDFIQRQGQTEAAFFRDWQLRIGTNLINTTLVASPLLPDRIHRLMLARDSETRQIEGARLQAAALPPQRQPEEAELQAWHQRLQHRYFSPQTRDLTLLILDRAQIAAGETIPEEALLAEYQRDLAAWDRPETRAWEQWLFFDQAAAQAALQRVQSGTPFEQAGAEDPDAVFVPVEAQAQADIQPPEFGAALFAAERDALIGPIQGPLGWTLARIRGIAPPRRLSFEEARPQLLQDAQEARAHELVAEKAAAIEDVFASQGSVEEAADLAALKPVAVTGWLREGGVAAGRTLPSEVSLAVQAAIGPELERLQPGDVSNAVPLSDGNTLWIRLDRVNAPAPEDFATARPRVLRDWTEDRIRYQLRIASLALANHLRLGKSPGEAAAAVPGAVPIAPAEVPRLPDPDLDLGETLPAEIFSAGPGSVLDAVIGQRAGLAIRVGGSRRPDPATIPLDDRTRQEMDSLTHGLLQESFLAQLATVHDLQIGQAAIDAWLAGRISTSPQVQ